jgi:hypothetical protein
VAPKPAGHFDFDTNTWMSDSPVTLEERRTSTPWSAPEAGHWIETAQRPPSFEERLWSRAWLLGLYFAVLLAVGICRFVLLFDPFPLCAFVVSCAIPLLAIVTIYSIDPKADRMAGAHKIVEDAQDPDVCPVVLTIFRDGLISGEDSGVAWFEGPCLFFNGSGCSFAVGRRDVHPEAHWKPAARMGFLADQDNFIFLRSEGAQVAVRLTPAFYVEDLGDMPEPGRRFLERKREFKPGQGGPDRSFYPPLTVSPGLKDDPLPFRYLLWVQTFAFIYFALLGMIAGAPFWVGIGAAGLCALAVPALRPRRNPKVISVERKA